MSSLLDRQREFTGWLEKGFPDLELKGLPLVSACAFTGNASQENLVEPVTTGAKDHGSDGVLQWREDRLDGPRGLKGWAASIGWPWGALKTQAAFTLWELGSDPRYSSLLSDLLAGKKKIETLTANICWIYERPAQSAAHLEKRISHAKSVFQILSQERTASPKAKTAAGAVVVAGASAATAASQADPMAALIIAGVCVAIAGIIFLASKSKNAALAPSDGADEAPALSEAHELGTADIIAAIDRQTQAIERLTDVLRVTQPPSVHAATAYGWPKSAP